MQDAQYYKEQLEAKSDMMAMTTRYLMEAQAELEKKNKQLAELNENIFSNIRFAQLMQQALLPDVKLAEGYARSCRYCISQQIGIGGDFIFMAPQGDNLVFGLFDCTGHGVSAAMLATSACLFLNEICAQHGDSPAESLQQLNRRLFNAFRNQELNLAQLEGTLFRYNRRNHSLRYASAHGKVFLLDENGVHEPQHGKTGVGQSLGTSFHEHTITLSNKARLLLCSDGLTDQFGGERNKKYGKKKLRSFLSDKTTIPLAELDEKLFYEFLSWKKEETQTDDVSFMLIDLHGSNYHP